MKITINPLTIYRSFRLTKSWVRSIQKDSAATRSSKLLSSNSVLNPEKFNLIQNLYSVVLSVLIIFSLNYIILFFFPGFEEVTSDLNSSFANKFNCKYSIFSEILLLEKGYDLIRYALPTLISLLWFKLFTYTIPFIAKYTLSANTLTLSDTRRIYLYLNGANTGLAKAFFLVGSLVYSFYFLQGLESFNDVYAFDNKLYYSMYYLYQSHVVHFLVIFCYPIYVYSRLLFFTFQSTVSSNARLLNQLTYTVITLTVVPVFLSLIATSTLLIHKFIYTALCADEIMSEIFHGL